MPLTKSYSVQIAGGRHVGPVVAKIIDVPGDAIQSPGKAMAAAANVEPIWPTILRGDPATDVCRNCPSKKFRVNEDGRPYCLSIAGCINSTRYTSSVNRRLCPLGHLAGVPAKG